jgi:hypothetical protein
MRALLSPMGKAMEAGLLGRIEVELGKLEAGEAAAHFRGSTPDRLSAPAAGVSLEALASPEEGALTGPFLEGLLRYLELESDSARGFEAFQADIHRVLGRAPPSRPPDGPDYTRAFGRTYRDRAVNWLGLTLTRTSGQLVLERGPTRLTFPLAG